MVEQDERQILPHLEVTEAINLGTEEEKKEVKIGIMLSPAIRKELIDLLEDYSDVFASKTCQASTLTSWYIDCL